MPTVIVNDKPVEIGASEKLNCIEAAQRAGFEIPHYCYHPSLSVVASCRMCLVEVGDKKPDGTVAMQPKLVPGCQTPVKDGTVVISNSKKVADAQKATLEYLLLNHPLDCPTCDQAGECGLQDYSYKYGRGFSRLDEPKNIKPDKDYIGDQITLFTDRCIVCTRCVRFTREISGTAELQLVSRGSHEEIDIFPGEPCNNKLAGNVVDLCPVGALCSKDFLYEQRVWWLKTTKSVCSGCSSGCNITVDQNHDEVFRLKPRTNLQAQGYYMCDDGRFGWKYIHSDHRLQAPEERIDGRVASRDWDGVLPSAKTALTSAIQRKPKAVAAIFSPWMTVEEAYLLAKFLKDQSPDVTLALAPTRVEGEDDTYPKDVHGNPVQPVKFTIRAEKAPNRRGVEAVLKHFQGSLVPSSEVLSGLSSGTFDSLYLVESDPKARLAEAQAEGLKKARLLIVQGLLDSPAVKMAHYVLAAGSFAERDGTFINFAGLAQLIRRAVRGPGESRADNRILWDLASRTGLFNGPALRKEIAGEVAELAALAEEPGELGVFTGGEPAKV
ncbi:NADH-quinone oxidoreductase chain 3 [Caulifigura coniformis]|uniref:NADH-quinone oxidoreductase chain 3 n=1 Tax=Caulifigura coniformis TaxID=2527983 RepID=A0A517S9V7_9PLAN|nr:molybdopterin-dependent oxidoreductase [Caulifigura coniformis]QDT52918.1 NADH-quinone oxidoreductase chain 3 [Caulifigura coniformis]